MHSVPIRRALASILLLFFAIPSLHAQAPGYQARIDSFMMLLDKHDKSMCGVAMYRGSKRLYACNIGYVKLPVPDYIPEGGSSMASPGIRAIESTSYHIGSESKMFTAAMILQLIDEQKLQRQTRLSAFFPAIPAAADMTIDQLLHHRSGLHAFGADPGYDKWYTKSQSRTRMLERVAGYPRDFSAGAKHEYNNTNYLLLGYIIELLDSTDYETALQNRIVGPLKLQHTRVYRARSDGPGYVRTNSYLRENKSWQYVKQTDPSVTLGAGSVEASPSDMCLFLQALLTGKLTSDSMVHYMTDLGPDNYGAAITSIPYGGRTALGHNGKVDGFSSMAFYFPGDNLAIAVTVNGENYPVNDIILAMLNSYFGTPGFQLPSFDGIVLHESVLDAYAGIYASKEMGVDITIHREDGKLTAQATGQDAFPLQAESKKRFSFSEAGIIMDFTIEESGRVSSFVLRQGGHNTRFTRE